MDKTLNERMMYFLNNYDVVFTYVHDTGETQYISDPYDKVCRFCGKKPPEVKFRKKAHAISELLGNKEFVLNNECDTCNELFGKLLEDELSKYLGLARTISQIHGKNGVPTYKSKDKKSRIEFDSDLGIIIKRCISDESKDEKDGIDSQNYDDGFVETFDHKIVIHAVRDTYTPVAVYKAFVKMALSFLPYKYLSNFIDTIEWIKEPIHTISRFFDLSQYGVVLEKFIPGVPFLPMRVTGFIRKHDMISLPFYQFYLEFLNFSYQMAIPCPLKDRHLKEISLVPILGTDDEIELMEWSRLFEQGEYIDCNSFESDFRKRYGKPVIKAKDFRNNEKVKNEPLDLALGFDTLERGENVKEISVDEFLEAERQKIRDDKK